MHVCVRAFTQACIQNTIIGCTITYLALVMCLIVPASIDKKGRLNPVL